MFGRRRGGLFIELYKLFSSKTIYIQRKTEIAHSA